VYSGLYSRGYRGQYSGDRHGYHRHHKKHHQHTLPRLQSQRRVDIVPAEEEDRFIPAALKPAGQRIFSGESVPSLGITGQAVNPSFSVQIDFDDDARDIISVPFTNSVDNIIPVQQSDPEDLLFDVPAVASVEKLMNTNIVTDRTTTVPSVPSVSATQQRLIDQILRQTTQQAQEIENILNDSNEVQDITEQQNSPTPNPTQSIPTQSFKFPPRIPSEAPVAPPVQQPLPIQPPSLNVPPSVLPQPIPAVPGRPVLAANSVQLNTVQSVQTVQQSSFIPMPVPAVPTLSN